MGDTSDDAKADDEKDTKAQANSVLCHEDRVSQKDCDEWVADQLARRAARKADEEKRGAARKADEQKRREDRHEDEAHRREALKETPLRGSGFSLSASSNPMGSLSVVGLGALVPSAAAMAYLAIQRRRPGHAIQEP